jgi:hypothetical protein
VRLNWTKKQFLNWLLLGIGYLLSPLSWWNDLFINLPLAYLFACLFSLFSPRIFTPAIIAGYWLTNITGLLLIHLAALRFAGVKRLNRRQWLINGLITAGYSLLILLLVMRRILKPFWLYQR